MRTIFYNALKCRDGVFAGIILEIEDDQIISHRVELDLDSKTVKEALEFLAQGIAYMYAVNQPNFQVDKFILSYNQLTQIPNVHNLYLKLVQTCIEAVNEVPTDLLCSSNCDEVRTYCDYIDNRCYSVLNRSKGFLNSQEYILKHYPGVMKRENLMASRIELVEKLRLYLTSGKCMLSFIEDIYGSRIHDALINLDMDVEEFIYENLVLVPNIPEERLSISTVLVEVM